MRRVGCSTLILYTPTSAHLLSGPRRRPTTERADHAPHTHKTWCVLAYRTCCRGTTAAQFGNFKASGRTREEAAAFGQMLSECDLKDGFRELNPQDRARSATCWAQKKRGAAEQRQHWKRYDYCVVSSSLLGGAAAAAAGGGDEGRRLDAEEQEQSGSNGGGGGRSLPVQLAEVRHLANAFKGGRPDHLPVESTFLLSTLSDP